MVLTLHFYNIFGTNLLTGGPARIDVFLPISVFPNGMKPLGEIFSEQTQSRRLGVDVREASRWPRGSGVRTTPLGVPPTLVGPLWLS